MTNYNSSNGDARPFSDLTAQIHLFAHSEVSYTVPGDNTEQYLVAFSWNKNANVWVGYNVGATIPILGSVTQNNGVEKNPIQKFVRGGDILNFISDTNVTDSGLSFYTIYGGGKLPVPPPPVLNNFLLLDNTNFLLLDGTNFLLL